MSLGNHSTSNNEKWNVCNNYAECRPVGIFKAGVPNYGVISKYFRKGHFNRQGQAFSSCLSCLSVWKCVFNGFSKQNTHIKAAH